MLIKRQIEMFSLPFLFLVSYSCIYGRLIRKRTIQNNKRSYACARFYL
ncbi:hypothetical protein THOB06_210031 [Vibrio rotiferianus]|nr:hypothetical protein THOB06_210031 [Vibrio rotiferianus]